MPIYLSGFTDNVVGFQFALSWDKNVVEYIDIKDSDYVESTLLGCSSNLAESGNLRVVCLDGSQTFEGIPFLEKELLSILSFKLIGEPNDVSPFNFTADSVGNIPPFKIGFRTTSGPVDVELNHATMTIDSPDANQDVNSLGMSVGQNIPNPFSDESLIPISLDKSGDVFFQVLDLVGREIYIQKQYYNSGKLNLKLDASMFESSGVYFYKIETIDYSITRKIFFKQN